MKLDIEEQLSILKNLFNEGYTVRKIALGQSMLPTIPDGAVIELKAIDNCKVKLGDIVFFASAEGRFAIHRVSLIYKKGTKKQIQTWGDNNVNPDHPVSCSNIYAQVLSYETAEKKVYFKNQTLVYLRLFITRYGFYYFRLIMRKMLLLLKKLALLQ